MNSQPRTSSSKTRLLIAVVFTILFGAAPSEILAQSCGHTLESLKKLSECELDRLFEQADAGPIPIGHARGKVLRLHDTKLPRLQARLANSVWKGKTFEDDGSFINQFPGFQALRSRAELGTSWHDGKPAIVIEYPPQTPLFGNSRDELREIAPGLYLARLYERCPCPRFRGYFAIQVECCNGRR